VVGRRSHQHPGSSDADLGGAARAAEYVRMSTDHQKYSTENQAEAIRQYAARRGLEIVRTYADEGKSGLRLDGRDALKQLIEDVQSGKADFTTILVYDVSRWGRFQDADESAYYEYICKRAGISGNIAPSNLKTTEAQSRPSSRASSARWPASTAGSYL
jgi:DNA invertase Pin-like site-specific DNA recombinase